MAISKVALNGTTLMDVTSATASSDKILTGYTAMIADGTMATGTATVGYSPSDFSNRKISGDIEIIKDGNNEIDEYRFENQKLITSVTTNVTAIRQWAFGYCTELKKVCSMSGTWFGANAFNSCTKLEYVIGINDMYDNSLIGCTKLKAIDIWAGTGFRAGNTCKNDTVLNVIVIRKPNVYTLNNINNLANMPFADGKAGGTLYVPNDLISSYQGATNWSTILGYANNSIQAIEGSTYESHWADGTEITTTHSVTYNLTNCSCSPSPSTLYHQNPLITYLTADSGYNISSVTVTRGGTDITTSAYDSGTGRIGLICSGDIVITATAT